jgi:ribosome-associated translation inhibitor RaiA
MGFDLKDSERKRITNRVREATKAFDIKGLICDVAIEKTSLRSKDLAYDCGVTCSMPKRSLFAKGSGKTCEEAAFSALSRVERQLRRHKTQVCDKWKRRPAPKAEGVALEPDSAEFEDDQSAA